MDYDIVTQLRNPYHYDQMNFDLLHEHAANQISLLRIDLAAARAQVALWRDIAMQAQDKVGDLLEKLYAMELRCDCP